jgi:hypothetical protein
MTDFKKIYLITSIWISLFFLSISLAGYIDSFLIRFLIIYPFVVATIQTTQLIYKND